MKTRKYSMKNHHYQMKTTQIFNEKTPLSNENCVNIQ